MYNHKVVDQLGVTFAALSDPTRRLIIDRLTRGRATVNELAEPFKMTQQAVSKHLAYLEKARLIVKSKEGRRNYCSLRPRAIQEVSEWTERFRRYWEESHDRLDELLEEMKTQEKIKKESRS